MIRSKTRIVGIPRLIVLAGVGLLAGFAVALKWNPLPLNPRRQIVPVPYLVPKIPGGTALRLAMVHDVLHERYLRHGSAWYTQRNLNARKIIAEQATLSNSTASTQYLNALDDLAVGLEQTGQLAEAISILQKKLELVSPLPAPPVIRPRYDAAFASTAADIDRHDLDRMLAAQNLTPLQYHQYTAFANIGTILLLDALHDVLSGKTDSATRSQIHQSLDYIEQALAINPAGHFGRETWQAIAIEHFLAVLDHPDLLEKYDLIGEPLEHMTDVNAWSFRAFRRMPEFTTPNMTIYQRLYIRARIPRVGIDPEWGAQVNPDYSCSMPFDEPTLAIIGMWTMGGGPSPHFALALGRIMQNIGQDNIAWNAYERAVELQDHLWPDASIRTKIVAICRDRQEEIAKLENPADPAGWQNTMRAQHAAELAWGIAYQKAYQDFEASQIAAGVPLNDPGFYTAFFHNRPSIASSAGLADDIIVEHLEADSLIDFLPCLVLGFGVGMALGVIIPESKLS